MGLTYNCLCHWEKLTFLLDREKKINVIDGSLNTHRILRNPTRIGFVKNISIMKNATIRLLSTKSNNNGIYIR